MLELLQKSTIDFTWTTEHGNVQKCKGFFVAEDLVVTAKHCCPPDANAEVACKVEGTLVTLKRKFATDDEIDIAILELTEAGSALLKKKGVTPAWLRCASFYPRDQRLRERFWKRFRQVLVKPDPTPVLAIISEDQRDITIATSWADRGYSGHPILDKRLRMVVGVVKGADPEKALVGVDFCWLIESLDSRGDLKNLPSVFERLPVPFWRRVTPWTSWPAIALLFIVIALLCLAVYLPDSLYSSEKEEKHVFADAGFGLASMSSDGRSFAWIGDGGKVVRTQTLPDGSGRKPLDYEGRLDGQESVLAISSDGTMLAKTRPEEAKPATSQKALAGFVISDVRSKRDVECEPRISNAQFSIDGKMLAIVHDKRVFLLVRSETTGWSCPSMKSSFLDDRFKDKGVDALTFSNNGRWLAVASSGAGIVRVYETQSAKILKDIRSLSKDEDPFEPLSLAFSPDDRWLALGNARSGIVRIRDWEEEQKLQNNTGDQVKEIFEGRFFLDEEKVIGLSFRDDGKRLVSVGEPIPSKRDRNILEKGDARVWEHTVLQNHERGNRVGLILRKPLSGRPFTTVVYYGHVLYAVN